MDQLELELERRDILGKKTRFLRRQGVTPLHVYGHGTPSMSLQGPTNVVERVLAQAGTATLISLKVGKEKRPRSVVVQEVQRDPLTRKLVHVDLHQVKMREKMRTEVPVQIVGEAPALETENAELVQELNSLTVECLPAKMPHSVEVDVSSLTTVDQAIRVKDVTLDRGVTVINDPELLIARVVVHHVRGAEVEEVAPEEKAGVEESPGTTDGEAE
ncbi:MAG: 50S ribosomal protein L25 [Chloroflexota bacterium]